MLGFEKLITGAFNVAAKGAYWGVRGAWSVGAGVAQPAMQTAFKVGVPATEAALSVGSRVGSWAMRHPEMATVAGLGAVGVGLSMSLGAEDTSLSTEESAQLAVMAGGPSTGFSLGNASRAFDESRMSFQGSTHGLTLGLWRGRHG